MNRRGSRRDIGRRLAGLVLLSALPLLGAAGACSGSSKDHSPARPAARSSSAAPVPAPAPPSAAWKVRVTHVAGRLDTARRAALVTGVRSAIGAYVDAAFLAGPYPRADFHRSFPTFTPGAAHRARADRALLTNQPLGPTTRSVRAIRRTAYLSVLAPRQRVAGVTAAVDLRLVVDTVDGGREGLRIRGRLLLGRDPGGAWRIFGYHLDRSEAPTGGVS